MRKRLISLVLLISSLSVYSIGNAEEEQYLVKVADPYIEMHTGAGRGYPIFYVAARGEWVQLLYRKTDWFRVRTEDGKEGWVSAAQLSMTLNPEGQRVDIRDPTEEDFVVRDWEYGATVGDFEGLAILTIYGGYHFTENISNEIIISKASGTVSSKTIVSLLNIIHEPFPEWSVSPFFTLGTGWIRTEPKSTLATTRDRTDQYANVGLGARMHLTKRFLLRVECKEYVVFTSRDENEEITECKAGFGFFF
ncbi:MAG: SH3 domain-containing protein [Thioalkalispiraceae bacterium]|jgi:hypothetical protein